MSRVRILYDFSAEGANELTAYAGEEFLVINATLFDGWIQVRNNRGEEGIVPSTYVEPINDDDDIPPPPSHSYVNTSSNAAPAASAAGWNTSSSYGNTSSVTPTAAAAAAATSYSSPYQANDSWNTTSSTMGAPKASISSSIINTSMKQQQQQQQQQRANQHSDDYDSDDFDEESHGSNTHSTGAGNNNSHRQSALSNSSHMSSSLSLSKHKGKNPYGLEAFLLNGAVKSVQESDKTSTIIRNPEGQSVWKRQSPPYQVSIIGYQSDKKYHGVKKFTSYEIQAEIFPQRVKRRYNHFDWLHKRLDEKFGLSICIPPLPDKAVTGNFEDEFIAKRRSQLELWLNRMSAHPVIGQSEVFVHFLQCDDASSKWKSGKRKAEKDEYRGAQWYCTLTVPGESVDTAASIKERVDKFAKAANNLDNCVKNVSGALEKLATFHTTAYKKELIYLGKKMEDLGLSLSNDSMDAPYNSELSTALVTAGNTYAQIGNLYSEQSKVDINLLVDRLSVYRGIIQQMPNVMAFEKSSIQMMEEYAAKNEKLEGHTINEVTPRRELISHVTFAEMNLFNKDKVDDINAYMMQFLKQQIKFYTEITECLQRAYASFEKIPGGSQAQQQGFDNSGRGMSFRR